MKRMFWGLGCTLATVPGLLAQDGSPSARLRGPADVPAATIRAQAPDIRPASAFDIPKPIPKSTAGAPPATLPVPPSLGTAPAIPPAPAGPVPPAVIIDPPGTPIPGSTFGGGTFEGATIPGLIPPAPEVSNWYTSAEALVWWLKSYSVPP